MEEKRPSKLSSNYVVGGRTPRTTYHYSPSTGSHPSIDEEYHIDMINLMASIETNISDSISVKQDSFLSNFFPPEYFFESSKVRTSPHSFASAFSWKGKLRDEERWEEDAVVVLRHLIEKEFYREPEDTDMNDPATPASRRGVWKTFPYEPELPPIAEPPQQAPQAPVAPSRKGRGGRRGRKRTTTRSRLSKSPGLETVSGTTNLERDDFAGDSLHFTFDSSATDGIVPATPTDSYLAPPRNPRIDTIESSIEKLRPEGSHQWEALTTGALLDIMVEIRDYLQLHKTRVPVDKQATTIRSFRFGSSKPDIFIWGAGNPCFVPPDGVPSSRQGPGKSWLKKTQKPNMEEASPDNLVDWRWCIGPIELKTMKRRGQIDNDNDKNPLGQIATYVREIFAVQTNRRFVPSLLVTEKTVEFILWDRTGLIRSKQLNFHVNPVLFCRIIMAFFRWRPDQMGFDETMYFPPCNENQEQSGKEEDSNQRVDRLRIKSLTSSGWVTYVVEDTLIIPYSIRSRGSCCWRAILDSNEDTKDRYLIQDAWLTRTESRIAQECYQFLTRMNQVGTSGLFDLISYEHVMVTNYEDAVCRNRKIKRLPRADDVVHTRMVWGYTGANPVPLETCKDGLEFLLVMRDILSCMSL